MVDFASLDGMGGNIPSSGGSVDPMSLTTPNSMITGTMAGLQQIGSPSLTVDSVKNLITVKPISTTGTQILRYGQVATGFLGMAVNDGTNDTMFAGQDNTGATVVKIAKSGFDAKTASAANLIFNSGQDTFKIVKKISAIIPSFTAGTSQANNATVTVPHGLTFTPLVQVYAQGNIVNSSLSIIASSYIPLPFYSNSANFITSYCFPTVTANSYWFLTGNYGVDATNVYIQVGSATSGGSADTVLPIPVSIFLLQETAT